MRSFLLTLLLGLIALPTWAQNQQVELAYEYYSNGEYEKAIQLYEDLIKEEALLPKIHRFYLEALQKSGEERVAGKYLKKLVRNNPTAPVYNIDYGTYLISPRDSSEGFDYFDEYLSRIAYDNDKLRVAALYFSDGGYYQYAVKSYQQAAANNPEEAFHEELAEVYQTWGRTEEMIAEYLKILQEDRQKTKDVQAMLQDRLTEESDWKLLEQQLVRYVQKQPNNLTYSEMLLWYLLQKKQFYRAFIQARALDKRMNMDGFKVLEVGRMALNNQDYTNATKIFEYLIKEYADKPVYTISRNLLIKAKEALVKNTFPIDIEKIKSLVADYQDILNDLGVRAATADAVKSMALLEAFYLDAHQQAITRLENLIAMRGISRKTISEAKLNLGDIYLLKGEPWEAALYYGQVEKAEKDADLGHQAKLKSAQLSYYTGDFELAKGHLDILKLATSREIANDAMQLSLLIQDNLNLDTTAVTMERFASVDLLKFQGKHLKALAAYDSLLQDYPEHSLGDEIRWEQSDLLLKLGRFDEAIARLKEIKKEYPQDILADDANFRIGEIYENHLNQPEQAMEFYKQQLIDYPGSIYNVEARKRFRKLRGDDI